MYILEASKDGKFWREITKFQEGQPSRFNEPFNAEIALKEAQSFKEARKKDWPFVRVIIQI